MDGLTPDQAQALFDAGGFLLLTNLPEGSEFGIDGTFHLTRRFSGIKFLPPGLHLITWSPPSFSASSGPSSIPLRSAYLHVFKPKERLLLGYDPSTEAIPIGVTSDVVISDDHLKTLDQELAAYPFDGLERWKALSSHVDQDVLDEVLGTNGRVDGMTQADGEMDEVGELPDGERMMKFPVFNLKRSWREGAVGEEITRYSLDKSWLLGDVITSLRSDPMRLLGHLQLAFILLLYLSSYSALMVYRRLLSLICRSSHILISASLYLTRNRPDESLRRMYISLVETVTAQLTALPDAAFETDLPEMDVFYLDEIEALHSNLAGALGGWSDAEQNKVQEAWARLQLGAKDKWRWQLDDLSRAVGVDEEDEEEEGEDAPIVVE